MRPKIPMTLNEKWLLIRVVAPIVPFTSTLFVLMLLPYPRSFRRKALVAILFGWVVSILYTTEIYNPVGIAYAMKMGFENPWTGFDNNNTAPLIFLGWFFPLMTVVIFHYLSSKKKND
jgi:hypothetical protein